MEKFYQGEYENLKNVLCTIQNDLGTLFYVEHICGRIKSSESVLEKLTRKSIEPNFQNAKENLFDIIGVRTVVRFIDDVYKILEHVGSQYDVLTVKDYIKNPKPNGYRSLHIIIAVEECSGKYPVEIQIRTISQDAWASLEHKMKYKKEIKHVEMISSELKRCADEMASIDISMQAIDDMIKLGID